MPGIDVNGQENGEMYDLKSRFQMRYAKSEPASAKYDYEVMAKANNDYNKYHDEVFNKKNFTEAEASAASDTNEKIYAYKRDDGKYVYFGLYEMNNYSQFYSAACRKVNAYKVDGEHRLNYSGYSTSKAPLRGGILTGIVDAELVIKSGGTSKTLKWSNGGFKFIYGTIKGKSGDKKLTGGEEKKKYNEEYFPAPGAKFWIRVDGDKVKTNEETTVILKFTSIKIKASDIKNNQAHVTEVKQNGQHRQPWLVCGGKMSVTKWISETKCRLTPEDAPNPVHPNVSINVYVSKVEGGKDKKETYNNNQTIKSDAYKFVEYGGNSINPPDKPRGINYTRCR